jgi:hypothetical protein
MSAVYNATLKNTRMTDVVTAIGATGYLNFYSSTPTLLASLPLANPAGTVTGGVLTFSTMPISDSSADATGTAASASVSTAIDGGGTVVISGLLVGTSGTDIVLSSTNIVAGQPVTVTAASITHG